MAGQREKYKGEETETQQSVETEDLWGQDLIHFLSEVNRGKSQWLAALLF